MGSTVVSDDMPTGASPVLMAVDVVVVVPDPVVVLLTANVVVFDVVVVVVDVVDEDDGIGNGKMLMSSGQSIFKSIATLFLNPKITNYFFNLFEMRQYLFLTHEPYQFASFNSQHQYLTYNLQFAVDAEKEVTIWVSLQFLNANVNRMVLHEQFTSYFQQEIATQCISFCFVLKFEHAERTVSFFSIKFIVALRTTASCGPRTIFKTEALKALTINWYRL